VTGRAIAVSMLGLVMTPLMIVLALFSRIGDAATSGFDRLEEWYMTKEIPKERGEQ
jgi:hypothetical protein